jgi:prolyl 4-hydroxylase
MSGEFGAPVRDRLLRTPGMMKLPAQGLDLFVLPGFLNAAECKALIARIEADRQPSEVVDGHPDPDYRTSESCNLPPSDPLIRSIERKLSALTGIPVDHGETIQGQRYAPGQQFKEHYDFFHTDRTSWPMYEASGGQRTWTAMIFLNAPARGGQTYFPEARMRVTPRAGNLLAWNNLDARGGLNPATLHQGLPVEEGLKYVITKWFRERTWVSPPA